MTAQHSLTPSRIAVKGASTATQTVAGSENTFDSKSPCVELKTRIEDQQHRRSLHKGGCSLGSGSLTCYLREEGATGRNRMTIREGPFTLRRVCPAGFARGDRPAAGGPGRTRAPFSCGRSPSRPRGRCPVCTSEQATPATSAQLA